MVQPNKRIVCLAQAAALLVSAYNPSRKSTRRRFVDSLKIGIPCKEGRLCIWADSFLKLNPRCHRLSYRRTIATTAIQTRVTKYIDCLNFLSSFVGISFLVSPLKQRSQSAIAAILGGCKITRCTDPRRIKTDLVSEALAIVAISGSRFSGCLFVYRKPLARRVVQKKSTGKDEEMKRLFVSYSCSLATVWNMLICEKNPEEKDTHRKLELWYRGYYIDTVGKKTKTAGKGSGR